MAEDDTNHRNMHKRRVAAASRTAPGNLALGRVGKRPVSVPPCQGGYNPIVCPFERLLRHDSRRALTAVKAPKQSRCAPRILSNKPRKINPATAGWPPCRRNWWWS